MRKSIIGFAAGIVGALLVAGSAASGTNGATQTYIVLYKQQAVGSDAAASIQSAGGTLVYSYPQIGVVIAKSDSASFRSNLLKDSRVDGADATASFATQLPE